MLDKKLRLFITVIAIGIVSCIAATAQEGSNKEPTRRLVERTVESIKSQKGYRIKFSAVTDMPNSDSLKMNGTVTVINPDIVYVNFEGSGGQRIKAIRKGKNILMEDTIAGDWVDPAELGEGGVGRGIHNPELILDIINKHSSNATSSGSEKINNEPCRVVELNLKGKEIKDILSEQPLDANSIEWDASSLSAKLLVGEKGSLLYSVDITASLVSTKEKMRGRIQYSAKIDVTDYNLNLKLDDIPQYAKDELGIK